jgi:hypothetical protein
MGIAKLGIGIKTEVLSDGRTAVAIDSSVIPEQTITILEHVVYPELRKAFDSGTFIQGDHAIVTVQIFDKDGNEKTPDNCVWDLPLDNYTSDVSKEVLGVLYFNWAESTLPEAQPVPDPAVIVPPVLG